MPRPTVPCLARRPLIHATAATLLLCAAAFPAGAGETRQSWSVHAFGLKVGELTVSATETDQAYTGTGTFRTTGLAGMLRRIRFTVTGAGGVADKTLAPKSYKGFIDTGKRVSETTLRFDGSTPVKTEGSNAPQTPIPASAKAGAFDPFSMMWRTLRDQSTEDLCTLRQTQYDGTRLVRITLQDRTTNGIKVTCSGTYDRIGGYSAEELAELKVSPLSITYEQVGPVWQASEVHLTSRHGKAALRRQE